MNLTCVVKESPEPPQYIFWYRDEQVKLLCDFVLTNLFGEYANVREIQMNECGTLGRILEKEMKKDISL